MVRPFVSCLVSSLPKWHIFSRESKIQNSPYCPQGWICSNQRKSTVTREC